MLTLVCPKLPMRVKTVTKEYYLNQLGFQEIGFANFESYMILKKDNVELHFFIFLDLVPEENYGQVFIWVDNIDQLYQELIEKGVNIHPNGSLAVKPWGQKEFAILDPDSNLITFGQAV